ncbi:MAG: DUF4197 domain-containing protein [Bacteroidetes bacterium]|nr:DUF4197 domain-containing protein [Bacteroidota bacterium]MCL2303101.1 DUF4197 domain-containing protein [Lentimicrobiaceae bacterium]
MKKCTYLLLLAVTVFFCSCEDKPDDYVTQLFTNNQISGALAQCADSTMVRARNVLFVQDTVHQKFGYYYYDGEAYRILPPPEAKNMMDTLEKYGHKERIAALILDMNRAAEKCGDRVAQFWNPIIRQITFSNPNLILHGGDNAITNYIRQTHQNDFISTLVSSTLVEQFNALNVISRWNELQIIYFETTGIHPSVNILTSAAQQVADGLFKRMALEEKAIREDPELRGPKTGWLYRVFETL